MFDDKKDKIEKDKEEIDYEKAIAIDPDNLDEEIFNQPSLYFKFREMYAVKEFKKRKLEEKLKVLEAKLDFKIRLNPEKFQLENLKSITEVLIKNTIQRQDNIQELHNKIIKINYDLNILDGAIDSLEHKKTSLVKAVDLYNGEYFAPIMFPHDIKGGKRIYCANRDRKMIEKLNAKNKIADDKGD